MSVMEGSVEVGEEPVKTPTPYTLHPTPYTLHPTPYLSGVEGKTVL